MNDETKDQVKAEAKAEKAARAVKVGDTVHFVHHEGALGGPTRLGIAHAEAKVTKVHEKGKFVDLVVEHEDPSKSLVITYAPREEPAKGALDTWHFPEAGE